LNEINGDGDSQQNTIEQKFRLRKSRNPKTNPSTDLNVAVMKLCKCVAGTKMQRL